MEPCTEPNRKECPRLCQDFCNKEQALADERDERLYRMGYDLEDLDQDSPYNQWMNDGQ